jgi:hypothetical protein
MANVTIPDLTAITTPGATTVIEVADPAATPISRKMTLANAVINGLEDANLKALTNASGALSVESSVANGASAVAFAFDTANSLANAAAKVASFRNDGTEVAFFSGVGGLGIGPAGYWWGDVGKAVVIAVDGAVETAVPAQLILIHYNEGTSVDNEIQLTASGAVEFSMFSGGTERVFMKPLQPDGSTPFKFDSAIAHTSGILLDLLNNGTSKFAVSSAGRIIAPSAPPANAAAAGVAGSITWDSGFIYICTATNTWKRVAIATW